MQEPAAADRHASLEPRHQLAGSCNAVLAANSSKLSALAVGNDLAYAALAYVAQAILLDITLSLSLSLSRSVSAAR